MQKINFTDTTITQKPYVTIHNVNYEVQDGIYTGGTDLNAQTFNTMQSNIEQAINSIYPVGSIIIRDDTEDMSKFLGFTWEKVFAGKVLVGVDENDNDFKPIGKTGGEKKHKLTVSEIPKHMHDYSVGNNPTTDSNYDRVASSYPGGTPKNFNTSETGGSNAHNNLQPYQVVAYWKRTA